ncbi:PLP-dependent aminotransferase family protein [Leucobacter sp. CSA2]|uniref:PLP-dependent aminotransferase family protein n=2 Tax=Leucobacter edaphi TaxID=2796472 RepID=A0A934UWT0_9MICO|nr:PLP-dependent aminotransferase family protein [Leucobacter edaphi]
MISLAGGNPDLSGLPLEQLGATAARLIEEQGLEVLQYGAGSGIDPLREQLAAIMRRAGIEADPHDILITAGSQLGLELVTSLFCNPGDVILAESPTYVGAIGTFQGLEAEVRHIECDDDGLVPESLERAIAEARAEGRTVKLLYTIPNFTNPSGRTLTAERRASVAEICRAAGITVVEDDPYGLVRFDGEPVPAIRANNPEVIYLGSLSKIFSPGIRIGWVLAPKHVRDRLQLLCEATIIHASILSQHLALEYLRGDWERDLAASVDRYRERAHAMLEALPDAMPAGTTWTTPEGGFFVWIELPEGYSADAAFERAVDEGVIFVPGSGFLAHGNAPRSLRLSFSGETPERIREGVARLGRAIAATAGTEHAPGTE